jgi:hypothetical protein
MDENMLHHESKIVYPMDQVVMEATQKQNKKFNILIKKNNYFESIETD